jgi:hypothetical protein
MRVSLSVGLRRPVAYSALLFFRDSAHYEKKWPVFFVDCLQQPRISLATINDRFAVAECRRSYISLFSAEQQLACSSGGSTGKSLNWTSDF